MSERTSVQTGASTNDTTTELGVPRWLLVALLLVLSLPFLMMAVMMLGMGLFGPPMHGAMGGDGHMTAWWLGVVPLLLVLATLYVAVSLVRTDGH